MNIRFELLSNSISDIIQSKLTDIDIDMNQVVQTTAISMLSEIQKVLQNNNLSDFYIVEEIIMIFEKYHIDYGICHDF